MMKQIQIVMNFFFSSFLAIFEQTIVLVYSLFIIQYDEEQDLATRLAKNVVSLRPVTLYCIAVLITDVLLVVWLPASLPGQ